MPSWAEIKAVKDFILTEACDRCGLQVQKTQFVLVTRRWTRTGLNRVCLDCYRKKDIRYTRIMKRMPSWWGPYAPNWWLKREDTQPIESEGNDGQ